MFQHRHAVQKVRWVWITSKGLQNPHQNSVRAHIGWLYFKTMFSGRNITLHFPEKLDMMSKNLKTFYSSLIKFISEQLSKIRNVGF